MIDVEALGVAWLESAFPTDRICTETPSNLAAVLPAHRVTRVGGGDRDYVVDSALLTVDTFGATREAARQRAEQVRSSFIVDLPGLTVGQGCVRATDTIHAPIWVPWDNTDIRRFVATYQLTVTAL